MLKTNTKAPDFKLPSTSKDKYSLKDSIGKYVVIYFYPKDDTPGCTIETNDFNKLLSKFKKLECEVYGISKDNLKSHDKFRDKYKIKFDLLADEELTVLKKYKVWGKKKFMGREFMGIIRTTFLIDKKGKIIKIWENVKVKDHAKDVLETIKNISKKWPLISKGPLTFNFIER
jgi:peroxiredoxin Q/BCP